MRLERVIQAELNRMEGGLFLDKEADSYGRIFYSIKHLIDGIPYTAIKWVYPDGSPVPLSKEILSELYAQEGSIKEAYNQAIVNNAVRKERQRQEAVEEAEGVAREWEDSKRARKSVSTGPGSIDHKTALNKRDL